MQDRLIEELTLELKQLNLRQAAIVSTIQRLTQEQQQEAAGARNDTFRRGDRVRVTNKVKKPATWSRERGIWREEEFRSAIVTRVTRDQIFILTDNGVSTWRAPNNLARLQVQHE
jgi:hypothetical protein